MKCFFQKFSTAQAPYFIFFDLTFLVPLAGSSLTRFVGTHWPSLPFSFAQSPASDEPATELGRGGSR